VLCGRVFARHIPRLDTSCMMQGPSASYVLLCTLPTQRSRSRPPVCDRPSGPSGPSGPALLALLLVIPRKASPYVLQRLAPDFTRLTRWRQRTNCYPPTFSTFFYLLRYQVTTVLTKSHRGGVVDASCLSRPVAVSSKGGPHDKPGYLRRLTAVIRVVNHVQVFVFHHLSLHCLPHFPSTLRLLVRLCDKACVSLSRSASQGVFWGERRNFDSPSIW